MSIQFRGDNINEWTEGMRLLVLVVDGDKGEDRIFLGSKFLRQMKPYVYDEGKFLVGRTVSKLDCTTKQEMIDNINYLWFNDKEIKTNCSNLVKSMPRRVKRTDF